MQSELHDIVKYRCANNENKNDDDFKKIKNMLKQSPHEISRYPVTVFQNTISPTNFSVAELAEKFLNDFEYVDLEKTSIPGLYVNLKKHKKVNSNVLSLLNQSEILRGEIEIDSSDKKSIIQAYEEAISNIVSKKRRLIYAMNISRVEDLNSYLDDLPHNISVELNKDLGHCSGINVPSYYVAGHQLFTDMHCEDSNLDSV
ncbi:uncharacterized protein LOC100117633 isoform X2 [Nasonia vitripennis]|nr:uncharacterized protein LOC100117633 isoform X2 [Nasonia vitripennis]